MPATNYARHIGGEEPPFSSSNPTQVKATRELVFFSGDAPLRCEPQAHWAFYRRPPGFFGGRVIGESKL